ncbi:4Fe-4S dicluster domain-containing protein, partial [Chloroflexota bacterium]
YYAVKDNPALQDWENMRGILKMADKIALVNCTCELCDTSSACRSYTPEICFPLNIDAQYSVESGSGRYITVDEAMKIVEHCEKSGLIHVVNNRRAVAGVACSCRPECCVLMQKFYKFGNDPQWIFPSRYIAIISEELCDGCGLCVTCSFNAIGIKNNAKGETKAVVEPEKCMGSGSCALKCPHHAIKLECIRPEEHVPRGLVTRPGETRSGEEYQRYAQI